MGSFASLGTKDVQASIMSQLGLEAAPISTQVVSRLHYADFTFALSAIAAALERLGKEIRNLQRSEINELCEGFSGTQVGSSTMPQKRNPHKSERICGIARIVRAQLDPVMETVSLEHERDLTNSSGERISLPTAACLTHYMLLEMQKVLAALSVDEAAVARNLHSGGGKQLAERIMMALAGKIGRQVAHELLRELASSAEFVAALRADARVAAALSPAELDELLKPESYVGLCPSIVTEVVEAFGVAKSAAGGTGRDGEHKEAADGAHGAAAAAAGAAAAGAGHA